MSKVQDTPPPERRPLIPESYVDVPTQRYYVAVLLGLCQVRSLDDFRRDCWYWNHPASSASFAYQLAITDIIQYRPLKPMMLHAISRLATNTPDTP